MHHEVRKYLAKVGRQGGKKSRRVLSAEQARSMIQVREAKRAFHRFYHRCFWSYDVDYRITSRDVDWVADQLKKHGDLQAWRIAEKLCR